MSASLIATCLWVLGCTLTAFLPMKRQYIPGLTLLIILPFMLAFLAYQHGPWVPLAVLVAAISLFRRPLFHLLQWLYARLKGAKS